MTDENESLEHLVCKWCAGCGYIDDEDCRDCRGTGWIKKSKMFDCKTKDKDITWPEIKLEFAKGKYAKIRKPDL